MKTKTIKKFGALRKKASFTSQETRELRISSASLTYYAKQGAIERIGYGIYRAIDAPRSLR